MQLMRLRTCAILAMLAAGSWTPCKAQDFAGKTITIVVPFSPGAVSDPLARLIAPKLADVLGAHVIVENRAGANTNLGNLHVGKSAPDGRTLLLAGTALTVNVAFYKDKLPFDPIRDFAPISLIATANSALVVHPSLNVQNIGELVALLKSKPGALNYASAGSGNMTHLIMEFFKLKSGTHVVHVPYRGAGPALNDVLAGHTPMMGINPGPIEPHVRAGRLHALAVTGRKRHDLLPEVPTFAEVGLPMPEVDFGTTFGLLAPVGTPDATLATLHKALSDVLAEQSLRQRLKSMGFEAAPTSSQDYADILRGQVEKWPPLIERAGITLN
jgi:tripartite-type tricarboxylate transporter receptor subunit TctC